MAGHSKRAQIKRKKALDDARRGKPFAKLIRDIRVAAREAGGEPAFNPRLRIEATEELDDVQKVHFDADVDESVLAEA